MMNNRTFNINKNIILTIFGVLIFLVSYRKGFPNLMMISLYYMIIHQFFKKQKDFYLVYIFYSMLLIFLLNRPIIDFLNGFDWYSRWNFNDIRDGATILLISVFMIHLGSKNSFSKRKNLQHKITNNRYITRINNAFSRNADYLIISTLCLFLISFIFHFYTEFDKLIYMKGRLYEEYYLSYVPSYKGIIGAFSKIYIYTFFFLLSFKLKKRFVFFILIMNIMTTIPTLIIGQRGGFILALFFSFIYYLLQTLGNSKQKWFGTFEKYLIVVIGPVIILLMVFINEGRHGGTINFQGFFASFKSFFHKQSVSFDTLITGLQYRNDIYETSPGKNFFVGEIIELFKFNPVSVKVFGTTPLPTGNNAMRAINGYSYAHILSYLAHHSYLKGFGFGTSYLLEVNQSYGIVGIILINFLIGSILGLMNKMFNKEILFNFIILILSYYIFYLPRQSFSTLVFFLFRPYFWGMIIYIVLVILIVERFHYFKKLTGHPRLLFVLDNLKYIKEDDDE